MFNTSLLRLDRGRRAHVAADGGRHVRLFRMSGQTWNSPESAESPPAWAVRQSPPAWVVEHAESEGWAEDALATWRTSLSDLGVSQVALTLDVRGATIDFDGRAPQPLNLDNAQPLHSALSRGLSRLEAMSKAEAGNLERRTARRPPDE
jgi:hypothetical protein